MNTALWEKCSCKIFDVKTSCIIFVVSQPPAGCHGLCCFKVLKLEAQRKHFSVSALEGELLKSPEGLTWLKYTVSTVQYLYAVHGIVCVFCIHSLKVRWDVEERP